MSQAILITGVDGSGKSAVCKELSGRGYPAFDIEMIDGFFNMVNKETGQIADEEKFDNRNMETVKIHDWIGDLDKTAKLITQNRDQDAFYCGTASNTDDLYPLFDKVFLLKTTPEVLRERMATRPDEKSFGKTEEVQNWVFGWKDQWENTMIQKGAIVIDAGQPISSITDQILSLTNQNPA
ncbi:MAG: AAA family ATPase [Candidatus Vogelbacteria bacterium]|nr:AAA family ATPase [Candidatus Vogelbacteria bacterium]